MTRLSYVLPAALLWACAAAPVPQRRPALDPSNPDAPESRPLPVSAALAPEPGSAPEPGVARDADRARGHEAHRHDATPDAARGADAGAADYTCPMHPEISQPGPGQCPKCGMALEPRKPKGGAAPSSGAAEAEPPGHEHHDHGAPR